MTILGGDSLLSHKVLRGELSPPYKKLGDFVPPRPPFSAAHGLGDEVPQKLKHFNNYELVFLLSDNSKRQ